MSGGSDRLSKAAACMRKGWINVSLPKEIVERIDKTVSNSKHGFRSRADFVLEAVKNQLRELGYYRSLR